MLRKVYARVLLLLISFAAVSVSTRSDCQTNCGNLTIDYPFGTSRSCYHDERFLITCNEKEQKAFLAKNNLQVLNISLEGEMQVFMSTIRTCVATGGGKSDVITTDFSFSSKNRFFLIGCSYAAHVEFDMKVGKNSFPCLASCSSSQPNYGSCSSHGGCCKKFIDPGARSLNVTTMRFPNLTDVFEVSPCSYAFVVQDNVYNFSGPEDLKNLRNITQFPVVIDWRISSETCEQAGNSSSCHDNTICSNSISGYKCSCQKGFQGNPYVEPGCEDIDECRQDSRYCG